MKELTKKEMINIDGGSIIKTGWYYLGRVLGKLANGYAEYQATAAPGAGAY